MSEPKPLTITVGIPAFNEEANIQNLLKSILSQKQEGYVLKEVIVVSDGSTDQTDAKVAEIRDPRVRLVSDKNRKGQPGVQNQIFTMADTDAVVLFEADILPADERHIVNLVDALKRNPEAGLIQGNSRPTKPRNFFGKVINVQTDIFFNVSYSYGFADWYASGRSGRLFTRKVYKSLIWPDSVPEDSYAHFWCLSRGIKTSFEKNAVCYYRVSESFEDLQRAVQKARSAENELKKYFSPEQIHKFYNRPLPLLVLMPVRFLLTHPIMFISYLYIRFRLFKALEKKKDFTSFLPASETTKEL